LNSADPPNAPRDSEPLSTDDSLKSPQRISASDPEQTSYVGPIPLSRPAAEAGSSLGTRYLLLEKLGEGGMGVVFKGWDCHLRRVVAIKLLIDFPLSDRAARFYQEARIASKLQHPGIITVHEFDSDSQGMPFIVMPFLEGRTFKEVLSAVCDREAELPWLLGIFFRVCQAIAFAHNAGVIHRDLKPANIMVGEYGMVTVMDWGLAKMPGENPEGCTLRVHFQQEHEPANRTSPFAEEAAGPKTRMGAVFGTLGYLSPEQARGDVEHIDKRSDVFSLGSILCEVLTGSPAFADDAPQKNWRNAANANLSAALARLEISRAPAPMIRLAKECLAPDPGSRPTDAGQVVESLAEYLESVQRRAHTELLRFFELSLDLLCIASFEGRFLRVNDNFPRTLGYSAGELTTHKFLDFVHPDDQAKTMGEMERLSRGEPTVQFLNRYRHAEGHYVWLEWSARAIDHDGLIYAIARDVSQRIAHEEQYRQTERERRSLAQVVESAADPLVTKDLHSIVLTWNRGAELLFGYAATEIVGRPITLLIPSDRLYEEEEILNFLRQGRRVEQFETVRLHKDGHPLVVSISVAPIFDAAGQIIGAATSIRDMSETKALQLSLERRRQELSHLSRSI
jgi:eukaryotic-like serine/threonine-protein kinase